MSKLLPYVITALLTIIGLQYFLISSQSKKIDRLSKDNVILEVNVKTLNSSLTRQNTAIIDLKVDYDKKYADYKKIDKDKYFQKYITKDINVTRSNCKDTSLLLDQFRNLGL